MLPQQREVLTVAETVVERRGPDQIGDEYDARDGRRRGLGCLYRHGQRARDVPREREHVARAAVTMRVERAPVVERRAGQLGVGTARASIRQCPLEPELRVADRSERVVPERD